MATDEASWERVRPPSTTHGDPSTLRLKVEGGWIYFMALSHHEPCAVFVPQLLSQQGGKVPWRG